MLEITNKCKSKNGERIETETIYVTIEEREDLEDIDPISGVDKEPPQVRIILPDKIEYYKDNKIQVVATDNQGVAWITARFDGKYVLLDEEGYGIIKPTRYGKLDLVARAYDFNGNTNAAFETIEIIESSMPSINIRPTATKIYQYKSSTIRIDKSSKYPIKHQYVTINEKLFN